MTEIDCPMDEQGWRKTVNQEEKESETDRGGQKMKPFVQAK